MQHILMDDLRLSMRICIILKYQPPSMMEIDCKNMLYAYGEIKIK